jgi:acetyltransferase
MATIERLTAERAHAALPALIDVLYDAVEGGASIGFMPPLSDEIFRDYWRKVIDDVSGGSRLLLVAREDGYIAGTVQVELIGKQNGNHRAEVQKLMVHRQWRNRGLGRLLLEAVDDAARECGRTLLVLDTEQDSVAQGLYERCGYTLSGYIPDYAYNPDGTLHATAVFYRRL